MGGRKLSEFKFTFSSPLSNWARIRRIALLHVVYELAVSRGIERQGVVKVWRNRKRWSIHMRLPRPCIHLFACILSASIIFPITSSERRLSNRNNNISFQALLKHFRLVAPRSCSLGAGQHDLGCSPISSVSSIG